MTTATGSDYRELSLHSSDSDTDDNSTAQNRTTEVAEQDNRILEEEDEREKLILEQKENPERRSFSNGNGAFMDRPISDKIRGRKGRSNKARRRKHEGLGEDGALMYEMEEGAQRSETSSQASSSSVELDRLNLQSRHTSKRRRYALWSTITISIAVLFIILVYGAYRASHTYLKAAKSKLLSNGTSTFAPTTILISLDGFRADFLSRDITPTLNQFIAEGVSPKFMHPSFPSLTFPNHFTLVTGLYPESHGIVGNTFWDPELQEEFYYTDPARSMQPKWWAGGEPIWVTAEKQGVKTAIHMWPGSEAGMEFSATYLDKYNGSEVLSRKTERILGLLDLPSIEESATETRPQLIAAYVPVVDADGHLYGPNSTQIRDAISSVDEMLHNLFIGLDERNLTDIVNVVIVSDHGMATTSTDRLIQLDDLIDLSLVEHIDGWPLYGLRPKDPADVRGLYNRLNVEAMHNPNFDVYLRDEDMPERFHFSDHHRIAPLWVIPKAGWAIVHKEDFDVQEAKATGKTYKPKGLHGYDHEHPLMRAIFIARGPSFPHTPNSRLDVFQNTEVYNIICDSLVLEPKLNNGTLRLPLKPVGLHSDNSDNHEQAEDLAADAGEVTEGSSNSTTPSDEENSGENESQEEYENFLEYMKAKIIKAMKWAHNQIQKLTHSADKAQRGSKP